MRSSPISRAAVSGALRESSTYGAGIGLSGMAAARFAQPSPQLLQPARVQGREVRKQALFHPRRTTVPVRKQVLLTARPERLPDLLLRHRFSPGNDFVSAGSPGCPGLRRLGFWSGRPDRFNFGRCIGCGIRSGVNCRISICVGRHFGCGVNCRLSCRCSRGRVPAALKRHESLHKVSAHLVESRGHVLLPRPELLPHAPLGPLYRELLFVQEIAEPHEEPDLAAGVLAPARQALARGKQGQLAFPVPDDVGLDPEEASHLSDAPGFHPASPAARVSFPALANLDGNGHLREAQVPPDAVLQVGHV